jgi:hypothetical protein
MKKVKFIVYADKEEVMEFDDNASEKEIGEAFDKWIDNNIECNYEEIEE